MPKRTRTPSSLPAIIQTFLAESAIGAAALRGQGAPGVVKTARQFLARLDLLRFATRDRARFEKELDRQTERLRQAFPRGARNWGAARKALNLFLRDAHYNVFLSRRFGLEKIGPFLEVPLDGVVAKQMRSLKGGRKLPRWKGVKYLTKEESNLRQLFLHDIAVSKGINRIHMDALLWVTGRRNGK